MNARRVNADRLHGELAAHYPRLLSVESVQSPRGAHHAAVAAALLAKPGLGITRCKVVGLSEREVVHYIAAARRLGYEPEVSRGVGGQCTVTLSAREEQPTSAARPASLFSAPPVESGLVGWLRAGLHQLIRRLGRRA